MMIGIVAHAEKREKGDLTVLIGGRTAPSKREGRY